MRQIDSIIISVLCFDVDIKGVISVPVLLLSLILIVAIIATITLRMKKRKKQFTIYEEVDNIRPYHVTTRDSNYSETQFNEETHYYSSIESPDHDKVVDPDDTSSEENHHYSSVDHHYDKSLNTIDSNAFKAASEEVHQSDNTRAETQSEDVMRPEFTGGTDARLFRICQDAGCGRPQVIATYEQVPTPNLADILRQVAIRNVQRNLNHFSKVKLFDTSNSRQADVIYERIATYEQVPDPALQRSTRSHASLYEVPQPYEVAQTYEVAHADL